MKAGLRALVILVYCIGFFILVEIDMYLTTTTFIEATENIDILKGFLGIIILLVLILLMVGLGSLIWPDSKTKKFLKVWRNIFSRGS
jgi:hypothetical protein